MNEPVGISMAVSRLPLVPMPTTNVPCTTVTCSSIGCWCGGNTYPSGNLSRCVNGPALLGSPSITMTSRPGGNAADAFAHTNGCGAEFAGVSSIPGAAEATAAVAAAVGADVEAVGAAAPPHALDTVRLQPRMPGKLSE